MFKFIIRYFGFLKFVPGLALVFDAFLVLWTLMTNPALLDHMDALEKKVLSWPNTTSTIHKYGGLQLNYGKKELGHIHGNGLLDMLLNRKLKAYVMGNDSKIKDHHSFKDSGWISFYIKDECDKQVALNLFNLAYQWHVNKG
ncbi:luciferase domain-containing protein [Mucilaginibacter phyllosphaerae]|uniref:Luciferase domain-containing protein n=1 Tax=Mucilaginibacter phyllosphaerae TaxID=1812349 RepID=A0A4Y8AB08_9SPHI|nr:luciferase family protein [Mucilaginibacter phyllosphaerae]MBB3969719.1 hypothetical protein [Mucilaginibacter phyllosphaerae]TEW65102.1 hypothetical protein E2R65_14395 [Mucilaginibacter phyllosphaerae]GGH17968.1 hypothetical protein GCM10007352_28380 [Mucilaginibacter phyllosphaerae]